MGSPEHPLNLQQKDVGYTSGLKGKHMVRRLGEPNRNEIVKKLLASFFFFFFSPFFPFFPFFSEVEFKFLFLRRERLPTMDSI